MCESVCVRVSGGKGVGGGGGEGGEAGAGYPEWRGKGVELGGCISCGVQAYRTVILFLAIRMRSGPPASWRQPRSALGVGAPVILPQRGYGRGDPKVGTLLPAMPADWLAGWPKALLAGR